MPVPTDAPIHYEFSSEEKLREMIRNGVDFFGGIRYYFKPWFAPSGFSLTSIIVENSGIDFNYSNGELSCVFTWFWNVDPDYLISTYMNAPNLEHHGRYYRFYDDSEGNPNYCGVVWKQNGAAFYACVPIDYGWTDIEYFCNAKLVRMDRCALFINEVKCVRQQAQFISRCHYGEASADEESRYASPT